MKKIVIATLATLTALSPALAPIAAADPPRQHDRQDYRQDRREDRQDRREVRRNTRDNGYFYNGRFYRGEPTRAQTHGRDFRYGYQQWRRGERLNAYERAHYYRVANYRAYHLNAPPRGYEWRRSNSGEYILAAVATGVILSVILNAGR